MVANTVQSPRDNKIKRNYSPAVTTLFIGILYSWAELS